MESLKFKIRRAVKIFAYFLLSAFALFLALFFISSVYVLSFYNQKAKEKADFIVVFGSAVWPNKQASFSMIDRVKEASELYKKGFSKQIIMSGAESAYGAHETDIMKKLAISYGVDSKDILLDKQGLNTCRSISNLQKGKSYIFVSNDFHLARISFLAKRAGIENFQVHASKYNFGEYLKQQFFFAREIFALWFYILNLDNGACIKPEIKDKIEVYLLNLYKKFAI